ncbi:MAG: hypothetical protein U1D97_04165 [Desulfuromonadales bacterium]|nr:hypothetical protein [Desulfuromonadales bacterium]
MADYSGIRNAFNLANWDKKYPQDVRDYKVESARHNLVIRGVKDLSGLLLCELETAYLHSAMWCDAVDCLKKRREFNKFSRNIQVVWVRGPSLSLHLGACETGGMHFWVGTGIAEHRADRFLQRIISQAKSDALMANGELELVPVSCELSSVSPNFDHIPVWRSSAHS